MRVQPLSTRQKSLSIQLLTYHPAADILCRPVKDGSPLWEQHVFQHVGIAIY